MIDLLLLSTADPLIEDVAGRNLLHFAAISKSANTLRLVLGLMMSCNVDINRPDKDGWTALHWGARRAFLDIKTVVELTEHGATCSREQLYGWTPMDVAQCHGALVCYSYLMARANEMTEFSMVDAIKSSSESADVVRCGACALRCEYGDRFQCRICQEVVFCYKCNRRQQILHPGHELEQRHGKPGVSLPKKMMGENERRMMTYKVGNDHQGGVCAKHEPEARENTALL